MAVLVDTSVWINAFRKKEPTVSRLRKLIMEREVATTDLIRLDAVQGARDPSVRRLIWDSFVGLEMIVPEERDYLASAEHFARAREKGISPGTIDCLLATLAQARQLQLWTDDQLLRKIAPIVGVALF